MKGASIMQQQNRRYRMVHLESDGSVFESEIVMDSEEAIAHLGMDRLLHILAGWSTHTCKCGLGFLAVRDDVVRGSHLEPVEDHAEEDKTIEDIALAVGLLAPGSHHDGLVPVA